MTAPNNARWQPTIRRDAVKRFVDGMMKANMKLYEQILDDPNGFGYYFNQLMQLALSEFKETRPGKKRGPKPKVREASHE